MDETTARLNRWLREAIGPRPPPQPPPPPVSEEDLRLRAESRAREGAARAQRQAGLRATGVPSRWVRRLAAGGFASAAEVAEAPDRWLLRCPDFGPKSLAALRERYPYRPTPLPYWVAEE
jgi:hypothetical protein